MASARHVVVHWPVCIVVVVVFAAGFYHSHNQQQCT